MRKRQIDNVINNMITESENLSELNFEKKDKILTMTLEQENSSPVSEEIALDEIYKHFEYKIVSGSELWDEIIELFGNKNSLFNNVANILK